jgi:hypothetical protein
MTVSGHVFPQEDQLLEHRLFDPVTNELLVFVS